MPENLNKSFSKSPSIGGGFRGRPGPYDIVGIGIGPFNLGMAALCHSIPQLNCLFIDKNNEFNWHPGMMIPGSRLQVPFYADLVTLADPCSKYSYMAFLKAKNRMFRFAIRENYFIKRTEYNEYCRWVVDQLPSLQFDTECTGISKEQHLYRIETNTGSFLSRHIVLGVGSVPFIPSFAELDNENVFHSSWYLNHRERILDLDSIAIIGSGQSAAEIFYDLLQNYNGRLNWFTRSERFFPMDYSKLTLEMSTPDYIDHFFSLPGDIKAATLTGQGSLYKGINHGLISDIYDMLDEKDSPNVSLHTCCELRRINPELELSFMHTGLRKAFTHRAEAVILATGYQHATPDFIKPLHPLIQSANRNYSIDKNNSIFVQNAEQATHGFNASDLSLGPYWNAVIVNTILGQEHFKIESGITFQTFGLPHE